MEKTVLIGLIVDRECHVTYQMTDMKPTKRVFEPFGFVLARVPALSVEVGERLLARLEEAVPNLVAGGVEAIVASNPTLAAEIATSTDHLAQTLTAGAVQESPAQSHDAVVAAVRRYVLRMSRRATPFGLCASYGVGEIGKATTIRVGGADTILPLLRLDALLVRALFNHMMADDQTILESRLVANPSFYKVGGEWRFIELHSSSDHAFSFDVGVVGMTRVLTTLLERCAGGEVGLDQVEWLHSLGYPIDEARKFILGLVRSQILVSELFPSITGPDQLAQLGAGLVGTPSAVQWKQLVDDLGAMLDQGRTVADVPRVLGSVTDAFARCRIPTSSGRILHVDSRREMRVFVSNADAGEILRAVEVAAEWSDPTPRMDYLKEIKDAFNRLYGDRDVPLLDLCDPTNGLGGPLSARLAEGLVREVDHLSAERTSRMALSPRKQALLTRVHRLHARGESVIALRSGDNDLPGSGGVRMPPTFSVLATLCRPLGEGSRAEPMAILRGVVGGSAGAHYGRFVYGATTLEEQVRALLSREQELFPNALMAEVNISTGPRTPNVSRRPHLRRFEISLFGAVRSADVEQIPLTELFVRIEQGKLILWWTKTGQRVVPRLSSMHGVEPTVELPLYSFLIALQCEEGLDWIAPEFLWGQLRTLPMLPRVTAGQVVVSRRTAWLSRHDLLAGEKWDEQTLLRICKERGFESEVLLAEGDHELPVDLTRSWGRDEVLSSLRRGDTARLVEALPIGESPPASGEDGRYANEVVIPYVAKSLEPTVVEAVSRTPHLYSDNRIPPGREWVYFKFYLPTRAMSRVLVEQIHPVVASALSSGLATEWHFLRYADSSDHLRVRLRVADGCRWEEAFVHCRDRFAELLREGGTRLELGTYEPELRRYGGPAVMRSVERLFHLDSELAVGLARLELEREVADDLMYVGHVAIVERLLAALESDADERSRICEWAGDLYGRLRGGEYKMPNVAAGQVHRRRGREIWEAVQDQAMMWVPDSHRNAILLATSKLEIAAADSGAMMSRESRTGRWQWCVDLIHMHCNRVFRSRISEHEHLVHLLLARYHLRRRAGAGT